MIKKAKKFIREIRPHTTNIFWSNVNQIVMTVCALVVSIVFTRLGSKELYGQYLFVLAWFGLFSIISIPGVRTVVFRATAQGYEGVYRKATTFSFLCSMFGIPLLVIMGVFFYFFKTKILGLSLIAFALFFPFMTSLRNWMLFLKGRSEFRNLAVYNSIKLLMSLIVITLSIVFTKSLIVILLLYFLVNSGFNILYHLKSIGSLRNDNLEEGWKRQSYALTIMDLSSIIFGRVDIVLLGFLFTMEQVAVYGLIMKFTDVFFRVIRSTIEAILPNLFKSKKITVGYFYKFFLLSFLIPFILYWLVKYPILLMYGREYSQVIIYSQLYLAIIPVYFLNSIVSSFMVKYQLNAEINISRITSMIIVIGFYSVLIPLDGIRGGVISSMFYYISQLIINSVLLKRRQREYSQSS